jgi:hypothetical protein
VISNIFATNELSESSKANPTLSKPIQKGEAKQEREVKQEREIKQEREVFK